MFQNGGSLSRVRKPRKNGAPLTASLRSESQTGMRERGPKASAGVATSRWSAPKSGSKLGEGKVYLTNTGLLMEAAEVAEQKRGELQRILNVFSETQIPSNVFSAVKFPVQRLANFASIRTQVFGSNSTVPGSRSEAISNFCCFCVMSILSTDSGAPGTVTPTSNWSR